MPAVEDAQQLSGDSGFAPDEDFLEADQEASTEAGDEEPIEEYDTEEEAPEEVGAALASAFEALGPPPAAPAFKIQPRVPRHQRSGRHGAGFDQTARCLPAGRLPAAIAIGGHS